MFGTFAPASFPLALVFDRGSPARPSVADLQALVAAAEAAAWFVSHRLDAVESLTPMTADAAVPVSALCVDTAAAPGATVSLQVRTDAILTRAEVEGVVARLHAKAAGGAGAH